MPLRTGLGDMSVPSKIYSIFAAGRPVIASVDSGTEIERIVAESEGGIAVPPDDPVSSPKQILSSAKSVNVT